MIHGFAGLGRLGTRAPPRTRTEPRACPLRRRRRRRREYFRMLDALFVPLVSLVFASLRGKFLRRL